VKKSRHCEAHRVGLGASMGCGNLICEFNFKNFIKQIATKHLHAQSPADFFAMTPRDFKFHELYL
jgi:hypothetical protein